MSGANLHHLVCLHGVMFNYISYSFFLLITLYGLFKFRITSEIMNPFRHLVGHLGRVISPSQGRSA
jgi:hypothetical protein